MACQYSRRDMLRQVSALGVALAAPTSHAMASFSSRAALTTAPSSPVAIQRCPSYDRPLLMARLRRSLDLIGGVGELVKGKTVAIKLNLTGGPQWKLGGLPAARTYHVHPDFVAATCAAISEAGAKRIVLLESGYAEARLEKVMSDAGWDIDGINAAGNGTVSWEDTRNQGSWPNYSRLKIPWGGYVYGAFDVNAWYEKAEVLVSLAKMKDHANAGVTLSIKNQFGIAPTSIYGDHLDRAGRPTVKEETITARGSTFHKGERQPPAGAPQELDPDSPREWSYRVPRITADLFGARPADLCLIDGIETNRGGEGPWIKGVQPLQPHLLLAGRNGVCTDAVATTAMGYDPTADHKGFPFMGDNHLALLADKGVGTHDIRQIDVRGLPLKDALFPFNPKRLTVGEPIFG
ncbi:MAG: DUF362 domain-containing protein [Pirellulales bacterium]